ncbi:MAG: DUF3300 domain-containing protein [bacterium]
MKRKTLVTALALALISMAANAQQNAAPPPSAPARRSAAELEKLVAPIALFSDPLIATILPASVYPLEIVQAARFVADTNNLAKLDDQPWDDNVKAVASVPAVIKMMNDDLQWTIALGEAFLAQDKELLDTIQSLRGKAQKAGTLQTTPQQIVVVTNTIIEKTVEQRVVVVTNTIVQIQPSNPQVVYVPTYNPYTVYYPPPAYVYNPYAPLVTFGVGIAVGAAMANHCDYHSGAVYVGHHGAVVVSGGGSYSHGDVNIDRNTNVNVDRNVNAGEINRGAQATPYNKGGSSGSQQKWQPDQKRLSSTSTLGSKGAASTMEARGYGSSSGARPSTLPSSGSRPSTSTGSAATRPSTGSAATRPSTGAAATRPTASPSVSRPASSSPSPSARPSSSASRGSAFGGVSSGSGTRSSSSRGSSSRSSGGFSGGGGRSSGGRSGGGRR